MDYLQNVCNLTEKQVETILENIKLFKVGFFIKLKL